MSWNDGGVEGKKQKEEDSRNSASADVRRQYSIEFDSTDWKTPPPFPTTSVESTLEGGLRVGPSHLPSAFRQNGCILHGPESKREWGKVSQIHQFSYVNFICKVPMVRPNRWNESTQLNNETVNE